LIRSRKERWAAQRPLKMKKVKSMTGWGEGGVWREVKNHLSTGVCFIRESALTKETDGGEVNITSE